jgi:HPr kinase/phosphorylase
LAQVTPIVERQVNAVLVSELLGDELASLALRTVSGAAHLDNRITNPRVQKPGLAFAGYYEYIKPGRVQIIGESETAYVQTLPAEERQARLRTITAMPIPVFVVTKGIEPLPELVALCEEVELPLLSSPALSSVVIKEISFFLEEHLVGDLRPGGHAHRAQRRRQERVCARPDHART